MEINNWLNKLGIKTNKIKYNLNLPELIEEIIKNQEGSLDINGSIVCHTGRFTGRSPENRFIVCDENTQSNVCWNEINIPIEPSNFDKIYYDICDFLGDKRLYIRDCQIGNDPNNQLNIRVITTLAWHNLFSNYLFVRPEGEKNEKVDITIICAPEFKANPKVHGTRSENFSILNLSNNTILIGGTEYSGEIKKGVFSILNYLLPQKNILSMHCSSNVGPDGDTALFFGLSGTGKTTLSYDEGRKLIGDDEHGWDKDRIFNFEGGCYAKTINLSIENEPQIYEAIKFGSIVENVIFQNNTRQINYNDNSITENTRTAYPIEYVRSKSEKLYGPSPKNIFFLTCDAYGVLPPISKLNREQTFFHFISGYTSKIAGTEEGITEPVATFSACFGEAFMPLHPRIYANLLREKIEKDNINVWLINTGWSGGKYGVGKRISLQYTRSMVRAALSGQLDNIQFDDSNIFELMIPDSCPGVDTDILDPKKTWVSPQEYDEASHTLLKLFQENYSRYQSL